MKKTLRKIEKFIISVLAAALLYFIIWAPCVLIIGDYRAFMVASIIELLGVAIYVRER